MTSLTLIDNEIFDITPLAGLTQLTELSVSDCNVSDITPLAGLADLTVLGLSRNDISDITPLAGLAELTTLWLAHNSITDLSPLVANPGIDAGDEVDVTDNPIDCEEQAANIQELLDRGVLLEVDCPVQ